MDSGDEDPGVGPSEEIPELSESMLTKLTDGLRELDDFQDGLEKLFTSFKANLSKVIISTEATKLCAEAGRKENTIVTYIDGIFTTEDDVARGHILHLDRLLLATINLADKHAWYEPETVREVRDKFYVPCKDATGRICELFLNWGYDERPNADLINWVFTDRLSKLISPFKRVALKEVGKKEKSPTTELLALILGWLGLQELKLDKPKLKEFIDVLLNIVTLEQCDDYDIHVRHDLGEFSFEAHCDCNESQFQHILRRALSKACREPEIFQYTLAHALSDPETLVSSSSWAFEVLASTLRRAVWGKLTKILDENIAPRLESANTHVKAKAAWMLKVCIDDKPNHVEDLSKYLITLLDFIHDKSDVLRKQSQICWYKVLTLNGKTPAFSDLKQALVENLSEKIRKKSIGLTKGYDIIFRLHKFDYRDKPFDYSYKIWLVAAAIMSPQMDKSTDRRIMANELKESIKKMTSPKAKNNQLMQKKLLEQFALFGKNYCSSDTGERPKRVALVQSVCKSLALA